MVNVMDILEGKNPNPGTNGDLTKEKALFDLVIAEIVRIHNDEAAKGLIPFTLYTYLGAVTGSGYYGMTQQSYDYYNNLLEYFDKHTKHPEIVIWRGISEAIKKYKLPLNQKKIPYIKVLMKKYCSYLTAFFDAEDNHAYETRTAIRQALVA